MHRVQQAGAQQRRAGQELRLSAPLASKVALSLRRLTHRLLVLKNLCLHVRQCKEVTTWAQRDLFNLLLVTSSTRQQHKPQRWRRRRRRRVAVAAASAAAAGAAAQRSQRDVLELVLVAVWAHRALTQPARSSSGVCVCVCACACACACACVRACARVCSYACVHDVCASACARRRGARARCVLEWGACVSLRAWQGGVPVHGGQDTAVCRSHGHHCTDLIARPLLRLPPLLPPPLPQPGALT